jgi:hypothetical protein
MIRKKVKVKEDEEGRGPRKRMDDEDGRRARDLRLPAPVRCSKLISPSPSLTPPVHTLSLPPLSP